MSDLVERLHESYEKDCFLMEVADELKRLKAIIDRQLKHSCALDDEIEKRDARIAELEDKLRYSDRKEIEACYRAMNKKDARIAELEKVLE